jgi:hypothetical protein
MGLRKKTITGIFWNIVEQIARKLTQMMHMPIF